MPANAPKPGLGSARRSRYRAWAFPIMVGVFAGVLWGWTRWTAPTRVQYLEVHAHRLISEVHAGNARRSGSLAQRTANVPGLTHALDVIDWDGAGDDRIHISKGDHATFGNGDATHVAMIVVDGKVVLGLRMVSPFMSPKSAQVIGYFTP